MCAHDEKFNLSIYIALLSFIYLIKSRFLAKLGVAAEVERQRRWRRRPV
jgi:hypothetical protein